MRKLLSLLFTALTTGLAGAFVVIFMASDLMRLPDSDRQTKAPVPTITLPRQSGPFSYADAVERAALSVVNILALPLIEWVG
ncbi:MAG: hypothetical protein KZQ66_06135 [Candidatus Thiodiazotropha sp. (ex Lucinoma aequizonata)]|nr:hypothetical protein [Candidatus Thiodiazotropha sp. (ex Lucinoma aequizonata)]MCU7887796.1 hypothetical protein [Candidatus Thiodiazotropha sp. (ex Lucinoma aequizonata)]MCU7897038.1 hypothetical protein [Candidatus Thiodiazotropha sp. (ex Lucinoma aequizonata)]MCU7899227.1 hypothetical protein [Candidatus Thiodiazotropha sp. (ex Lucinoma aequizonata)]MCU7901621.1 hypothetical protein [Candidatus Thiodiazotropha sp. (ex Lucinoma aequizonata)]